MKCVTQAFFLFLRTGIKFVEKVFFSAILFYEIKKKKRKTDLTLCF